MTQKIDEDELARLIASQEEEQQLSDAYLEQESFHRELEMIFHLLDKEAEYRLRMKQVAILLFIACCATLHAHVANASYVLFVYSFGLLAVFGLEVSSLVKIWHYNCQYDLLCVSRQTGDKNTKYLINPKHFPFVEYELVDLLAFDNLPFYLILWLSLYLSSGV